jgi:NADPH-dependent stearoyl-CoA 9-desaturase
VVICCGHFADGAEKFVAAALADETKPEWYLRQMLGTANFNAGPVLAFMSGNLCYQIEHHLFPDPPGRDTYRFHASSGCGSVLLRASAFSPW